MYPRLLTIGSFTLHSYGLLVAAGFLIGITAAQRFARRFGLDPELIFNLAVLIALAAMVGGKVFLLFQDWRDYLAHPGEIFSLEFLQSFGIFYGGVVFALVAMTWYVHRHRLRWLAVGDSIAPGVAIGHAFGRLGCFSAGCCYGKPVHGALSALGIVFTDPYAHATVGVPLGIPLYPTQLMESAAEFIIFGILWMLARQRRFEGQLVATYLFSYGIVRYLVDYLRVYEPQAMLFHGLMTDAQLTSLVMIALAIVIFVRAGRVSHTAAAAA
jgi:phosphatidylglycerol:prolipoprotein diacylglycerol transferase